jgi:hypothetical protein
MYGLDAVAATAADAHVHEQRLDESDSDWDFAIKLEGGTGETGDSGCMRAGEASCVAGWDDIDDILGY